MTSTTTPSLDGGTNTTCSPTPGTARGSTAAYKIWYSTPSTSAITDVALDGSTLATPKVQVATPSLTSGSGWIPINFDSLTSIGGSPISNIPVDPTNTITTLSEVAATDLVYRYACSVTPLAYEVDATLESAAYTSGTDNKLITDGGNSTLYYETGTNLLILGAGGSTATNF